MLCYGLLIMFCQVQEPVKAVNTYCDIAKPIVWAKEDTRQTKEQADRENRKYKKLCFNDNKKKPQ